MLPSWFIHSPKVTFCVDKLIYHVTWFVSVSFLLAVQLYSLLLNTLTFIPHLIAIHVEVFHINQVKHTVPTVIVNATILTTALTGTKRINFHSWRIHSWPFCTRSH